MAPSAPSSRVLLLSAPGTAADAAAGTARIRRFRLARVPGGTRPARPEGGSAGGVAGKPRT